MRFTFVTVEYTVIGTQSGYHTFTVEAQDRCEAWEIIRYWIPASIGLTLKAGRG